MMAIRPVSRVGAALVALCCAQVSASEFGLALTFDDVGAYCPELSIPTAAPLFGMPTFQHLLPLGTAIDITDTGWNTSGATVRPQWDMAPRYFHDGNGWSNLPALQDYSYRPTLPVDQYAPVIPSMVLGAPDAVDATADRAMALRWPDMVDPVGNGLITPELDALLSAFGTSGPPGLGVDDLMATTLREPTRLGCSDLFAIPFGLVPGDSQQLHMTTGTEGGGPGAVRVQASLALAYGGGLASAALTGSPLEPSCSLIEWETIDACFLPAVGLLSARVVGNVGCSGTIVGPYQVLTAAHCVCVAGKNEVIPPGGIVIGTHAGLPDMSYHPSETFGEKVLILNPVATASRASVRVRVEKVEVFGEFCLNRLPENDLALVTVFSDTPFPDNLHARLATPPAEGTKINIVGFGRDLFDAATEAGEIRNIKRYLSAFYVGAAGAMLAVRAEHGDSCKGDSGSGAYLRHADGSLLIFGVLSRGDRACFGAIDATYIDLSNPRYDEFLAAVRQRAMPLTDVLLAADSDKCIGDLCADQYWIKRPEMASAL